jgi:neural Wiskott-Aldrich syndrome protein
VADSRSLLNTLEKLRSLHPQNQAPTARYSPPRSGAPLVGGSVHGTDNTSLNAVQRGAIGDKVRECWSRDAGALHADTFTVHLIVTTDEQGVARLATIAPGDPAAPLGSPLHAFAERAVRAVLAPQCSALPLPETMRGQIHRFDFIFKP